MNRYRVLKAALDVHRDPIIELKRTNLKNISEDEYDWKYERSPAGHAECWVAQDLEGGSYVGATALFPRSLSCGGERLHAAVAGDFSVNVEHRAGGPAIRLQRDMISSVESGGRIRVIYGIPNEKAVPIFNRIGFARLGSYCRYRKILSFNYREGSVLVKPEAARRLLDGVLGLVSRETFVRIPRGIGVENVDFFDDRFDALWEKTARQFGVAAERTSDYLNWRFLGHPAKKCEVLTLTNARRDLLGYVVHHSAGNVCSVVDLLSMETEGLPDILMASFLRSMRERGLGSVNVSCMGSERLVSCLKKFQFIQRPASVRHVMGYVGKDVAGRERLLDGRNWYFLPGDTDSDLVRNRHD